MPNTIKTAWQIVQRKNGYYSVKYKNAREEWELTPEIMRYVQEGENVHFFTYAPSRQAWEEWIVAKNRVFSHAMLAGIKTMLKDVKLPQGVEVPAEIQARLA